MLLTHRSLVASFPRYKPRVARPLLGSRRVNTSLAHNDGGGEREQAEWRGYLPWPVYDRRQADCRNCHGPRTRERQPENRGHGADVDTAGRHSAARSWEGWVRCVLMRGVRGSVQTRA